MSESNRKYIDSIYNIIFSHLNKDDVSVHENSSGRITVVFTSNRSNDIFMEERKQSVFKLLYKLREKILQLSFIKGADFPLSAIFNQGPGNPVCAREPEDYYYNTILKSYYNATINISEIWKHACGINRNLDMSSTGIVHFNFDGGLALKDDWISSTHPELKAVIRGASYESNGADIPCTPPTGSIYGNRHHQSQILGIIHAPKDNTKAPYAMADYNRPADNKMVGISYYPGEQYAFKVIGSKYFYDAVYALSLDSRVGTFWNGVIISAAWYTEEPNNDIIAAMDIIDQKGFLLVTSVKNSETESLSYPCYFSNDPENLKYKDNVICCSSTNSSGTSISSFSNKGKYIDLLAPGEGYPSTTDSYSNIFYEENLFGTSLACAVVTGVTLLSAYYQVSYRGLDFSSGDIKKALIQSSEKLPGLDYTIYDKTYLKYRNENYGFGIVRFITNIETDQNVNIPEHIFPVTGLTKHLGVKGSLD